MSKLRAAPNASSERDKVVRPSNDVPPTQVKNYQAHVIFDKYKYSKFSASKCTERELELFANTERQKHVKIKKFANETFGFMITETGKTSLLPCVFISHIFPGSAAARCGQLFVGDQVLFLNGTSLVGLPFSKVLDLFKHVRYEKSIELMIVPMPPVDCVQIGREEGVKLGFDVHNGEIVSVEQNGLADKAGLKPGHRITEVNGLSVIGLGHDEIVGLLQKTKLEIKTMPNDLYETLITPVIRSKEKH